MNKRTNYIIGILLVLSGLGACTPDEIIHPNQAGLPIISELEISINVDSANFVSFHLDNEGYTPVWIFSEKEIVSQNDFRKQYKKAGKFSVEVKAYNKNGLSDGSVVREFVIESDYVAPFDPSSYISNVSGGSSKTWIWDYTKAAHFGCGEPGSNGTNWWTAGANEKAGTGLYDDQFTFTSGGAYTYNPGDDGLVYVNFASGYKAENLVSGGVDYDAPTEKQETTYSFIREGEKIYIEFPVNTIVSYIPNPEALTNPKYRVISITSTKIELVIDNGAIAWYYRLIPKQ